MAKDLFEQKENKRFNKIWFKEFLKRFKEGFYFEDHISREIKKDKRKHILYHDSESSD